MYYNEVSLNLTRKGILIYATVWMKFEVSVLREISHRKVEYCMIPLYIKYLEKPNSEKESRIIVVRD